MTAVFRHGALRLYLLKLLGDRPRHGYEIISLLEDRFLGLYAPSAGTVYPRLAKLEAEGFIEHEEVDGRKVYRLTDAGREELERSSEALQSLERDLTQSVSELARDVRSQVHESVRDLRAELKQAAREVRREARSHARTGAAPRSPDPTLLALAEQLRTVVRSASGSAAGPAVEAAADSLRRCLAEVRQVLRSDTAAAD